MSFSVTVVADILKFPWPLFPRYKNTYPLGLRYDIPAFAQTFEYIISLPPDNKYELTSFVFATTGYKDGDKYTLLRNDEYIFKDIYTKELGQIKEIKPVRKIVPGEDILKFLFQNDTGTSKVIWIDLDFTSLKPVNI